MCVQHASHDKLIPVESNKNLPSLKVIPDQVKPNKIPAYYPFTKSFTDHVEPDEVRTYSSFPKKSTNSKSKVKWDKGAQDSDSLDKSGRLVPEGGERPVWDDVEGARLPQAVVLHVKPLEVQICGNELKVSLRFLSTFANWRTWKLIREKILTVKNIINIHINKHIKNQLRWALINRKLWT